MSGDRLDDGAPARLGDDRSPGRERPRSLHRGDSRDERLAGSELQDASLAYAAAVESTDPAVANPAYERLLRAALGYATAVLGSFGGGG